MPRRALEVKMNRIFGQALWTETARDLAAKDRPDNAVGVADIQFGLHFFSAFQSGRSKVQQHLVIEGVFQTVILRDLAITSDLGTSLWLVENR